MTRTTVTCNGCGKSLQRKGSEVRTPIEEAPPSKCDMCGVLSGKYNLCGNGSILHCIYAEAPIRAQQRGRV